MKNEFDKWSQYKQSIHHGNSSPFFKEREIWWCLLGKNIGFEQNGDDKEYKRPVLIIKRLSLHTCFIVPLTSSEHKHSMRIPIGFIENMDASVIISQLRIIDTKRLARKICMLEKEKFETTRKAIKDLL
ncbi:MAG: type II toxin-antitoxin system PemK/MazF family toxin [Patescibacteria group bacterium]